MRAVIVCGGDVAPELLPARAAEELWIAADSGYAALAQAGIRPDCVIGDFDSLGYVPAGATVLPVRKDDTDLMAAVRLGLARGAREFLLFGTLGGPRFSHSLAAVQTLGFLAAQGAEGTILDRNCTVTAVRAGGEKRYPAGRRGLLSVFALSGRAVVTLEGLSYPLERHTLTPSFPLGVSNAFTGGAACVRVERGTVILVEERQ